MPGSKRERSPGKWTLTVTLGFDYTGKKIRFNKTFHGTAAEAEKALALFYADCERGLVSQASIVTIDQMVTDYIETRPKDSLKENTVNGYKASQRNWISPYIGHLHVNKVRQKQLQEWIDDLSKNYSPKTVKNARSLLSAAFGRLLQYGEIHKNPCEHLIMPKLRRSEAKYYSKEETAAFIKALGQLPSDKIVDKVLFELALFCGLRKGEILGLDWQDVDLVNCTVKIRQTRYTKKKAHMREDTPKTEKSQRTVGFPVAMKKDFVSLASFYSERKLLLQAEWIDSPAVIRGEFGDPLYGGLPLRHLNAFQKKYGLKKITLHQLRHTNVSAMISLGLDIKTIQERGGYSNASTPLEIYGHLFNEQDQKVTADIYDQMTGAGS